MKFIKKKSKPKGRADTISAERDQESVHPPTSESATSDSNNE